MENKVLSYVVEGNSSVEVYDKMKDVHPERVGIEIRHGEKQGTWDVNIALPTKETKGTYVAGHYGGRKTAIYA